MNSYETVLVITGFFALIPSIASLTKFDQWWIRGFDFPRVQISFFTLLVLICSFFLLDFNTTWHYLHAILLIASFIYQAVKIFPYTFMAKKQVLNFKGSNPQRQLSILVSNVLATNTKYDRLLALISRMQPDLLLTLETNKNWEKALSVLEKEYPFTVKKPQENLYGMHLFSKLELVDIEVKNLISEEIPSIHGYVRLKSGEKIRIHCLHPKPPSPTEDPTSTNRDAELLIVGKESKAENESVLVFGDLNDVAWSRTTKLFQKISGLLDPRIGRGLFNTFHTAHPLFRWPLDHIFHTNDFTLVELQRLEKIGSDHFPIFVKLNYEPRAEQLQEEPEKAEKEEKEWADEKIERGDPLEGV